MTCCNSCKVEKLHVFYWFQRRYHDLPIHGSVGTCFWFTCQSRICDVSDLSLVGIRTSLCLVEVSCYSTLTGKGISAKLTVPSCSFFGKSATLHCNFLAQRARSCDDSDPLAVKQSYKVSFARHVCIIASAWGWIHKIYILLYKISGKSTSTSKSQLRNPGK
jgi:hypothetical protein